MEFTNLLLAPNLLIIVKPLAVVCLYLPIKIDYGDLTAQKTLLSKVSM